MRRRRPCQSALPSIAILSIASAAARNSSGHGDGIDCARLQRPLGALLRAKNDPFGAWPQAGETRQADGAPIAGEQTQGNLRKADFRGARQHPIVGRERDLEPAAERKTVDRRDRWYREIGQRGDDLAIRADKSLDVFFRPLEDAGEFENIGAHDEMYPWRW